MIKRDDTFEEGCLFGSLYWVSYTLGRPYDWLMKNRQKLKDYNFPEPDPLTGRVIKADVFAWINSRRKFPDHAKVERPKQTTGNLDGL